MKSNLPRGVELMLEFCPTGPGGGVDPTCSPDEKVSRALRAAVTDVERQLRAAEQGTPIIAPGASVPTVAPGSVNQGEMQRLQDAFTEARAAESDTRRALRLDPQNAAIRAQHNANGRATRAARNALEALEASTGVSAETAGSPEAAAIETETRATQEQVNRAQRAVRATRRVRQASQRIQNMVGDRAASIEFMTAQSSSVFTGQGFYRRVNPDIRRDTWLNIFSHRVDTSSNAWSYFFDTTSDRTFSVNITGHAKTGMYLMFSDDQSSTALTGRGEAFEVFSNVVPAVVSMINKKQPIQLTFSASGDSRIKLYHRLAKSICAVRPQYKVYKRGGAFTVKLKEL